MVKILYLQLAVLLVVVALSGLIGGSPAAWSAAAGGVSYVLPSAVTVLFLNIFRSMPQYAGYAFIFGEGLRIVLALVLMVAFFALYHQELRFIPFLLGLLAASHVIFFIFWKAKYHVKRK